MLVFSLRWICKFFQSLLLLSANKLIRRITGKTAAASIPALRFPPNPLEMYPASDGPAEQPKSPASASIANNAVPPPRIAAEALLNVPGQSIPTENPQIAHPSREIAGTGIRDIHE